MNDEPNSQSPFACEPFAALNQLHLWDFRFQSYQLDEGDEDRILTIEGSKDLSTYVEAKIRFIDVGYIDCPVFFCHAMFRMATEDERRQLGERVAGGMVVCIVAQHDSALESHHFIVAERVIVSLVS